MTHDATPSSSASITCLAPAAGCPLRVGTELVTFKLRGTDTAGAFALAEMSVPPGGGPPGLHTHPSAETFLVLDGVVEVATLVDGQVRLLVAPLGAVVHIPGFAPHTFRNSGAGPARLMLVVVPAELERFILDAGLPVIDPAQAPAAGTPADSVRLMALYRKHGIAFLDPPRDW